MVKHYHISVSQSRLCSELDRLVDTGFIVVTVLHDPRDDRAHGTPYSIIYRTRDE